MAARSRDQEFDYDSMPKRGILYPTGYFLEEVESVTKQYTEKEYGTPGKPGHHPAGSLQYAVKTRILDVGKQTEDFVDQEVYHNFTIGMEGDEEAEDPKTWLDRNNFGAGDLVSFLVGCKLIKGKEGRPEGKGTPPWEAIDDAEGCKLIDHMGERAGKGAKSGEVYQSHRYFSVGERDPGLLADGNAAPTRRKRESAPEPEPEREAPRSRREPEEPEQPARRRR